MATLLKRGFILLYVLFCILPAGAQTFTDGDFTFKVTGEGTCSVTGTTLTSGALIIPNTATDSEGKTYNVTSIEWRAFQSRSGFTGDLKIPESVTSIGTSAFSGCSGFTGELKLPEGLTSIGRNAFYGCSGFTGELKIPEGVTSIEMGAFSGCSGLTGPLNIPEGVTSIESFAFENCTGFNGSLTLPNALTSIGASAFYGCSGFTGSLTIPEGITSIEHSAFHSCTGFNGELTLPKGLTTIGKYAFYRCSEFTGELSLPVGLTSIADYAFMLCYHFTGALILPDELTSIGKCAFSGCSGLIGKLKIPEGVTSIGSYAFDGCRGFTGELILPEGLTSIEESTFYGCSGFTGELKIPVGITSIKRSAFNLCRGFTGDLTIPDNVTSIGQEAFANCTNLAGTLILGRGLNTLSRYPFSACNFTKINSLNPIPPTSLQTGEEGYVFDATTKTAVLSVPAGSEAAYEASPVWSGFSSITTLEVDPTGVTLSASSLLMTTGGKRQLTATVAPEDATDKTVKWTTSNPAVATVDASGMVTAVRSASEGENSRVGTATITSTTANGLQATCRVTVRPRTATIAGINHRITYADEGGGRTFATVTGGNADEDGEITVHDELLVENGNNDITVPITRIEPQAFTGRTDVTKVVIPKSVTYIGNEAFANCTALEEIIIEDAETLLDCDADVFKGSSFKSLYLGRHTAGTIYADHHSLDRLEIGELVDEIDENEFRGCDPITGLYVYAEVPPTLPDNGFDESVYENTYLHVPSASIEAYREADGWKKFNHDNHIIALDAIPAENIALDVAELPLVVGQSKQLIATITPENVTTKTLRWSSSDATVASVASNGTVLGRKVGTATITVRTVNNLTATCTVTVSPKLPESIELDRTEAQITEKATLHLSATIFPEDVTDPTVTWTSSDETVATVDEEGLVSALTPGTVTITAATVNDLTAECTITVTAAAIPVKTISLTRTKTDIQLGLTITLRPNITPTNATDKTVTWTSSDSEVASVTEAGVVTALKLGTATITVATVNGLSATCVVTVVPRTETIGGIIYEIIPGGGEDGEDVVKVIGGDPDDDGTLRIPDEVEIDGKLYPVTEIGAGAFKDREDITKVVIPASVTKVGDEAFSGCKNLREVEAEDGDKLLACGKDAFKDAPIEELYLGRDTSGKPFAGNPELTAVTIGDKVTSIGSGDFGGCTSIVTVTVHAPVPPALADDGFEQQVYAQATLFVPDGSVDDYKSASGWKNFYDILGINEIRPVDIEMELADAQLTEGETMTLKAVITPDNATNQTVTWTSSDATVATVDASGVVTALKAGTATITASTANGLTATCAVTVTAKPSGIEGVEGESQAVTVEGGDIVVSGGERAEVYSITGIRVAVVSDGRVSGLPRGVYLVRLNGKTVKIRL